MKAILKANVMTYSRSKSRSVSMSISRSRSLSSFKSWVR